LASLIADNAQEYKEVEAEERELDQYYQLMGIKTKDRLATIAGHLTHKFNDSIRYDPTGPFHE
jgi:hypothetical protein